MAAAEAAPAPSVAQKAEVATGVHEFVASGPIIVENQVDVTAQRDGLLSIVLAEPGTPVKKGQLLATLDDRQVTADL